MILKVERINKTIKSKHILKNISFNINKGECVALIGPNGAGKTTLFNILLGELTYDTGNILIDNIKVPNSKVKNILAILNQSNNVPEKLKVKELIKFFQEIYDNPLDDKEVDNILNFSKEQKNQLVSKLSGGQKRFLTFVLTLIGRPKILFLDEPTSAMDTSTRKTFWKIINSLKEQGVTVIYSSHYIEEVEHTADKILLLNNGELIRDTTPYSLKAEKIEKIFTLPSKYVDVVNNLDFIKDIAIKSDNVIFSTSEANRVWLYLVENGCSIEEVEITNRTLLDSLFNTTNNKGDN
ncbi:ABC transporter ATP-binding protein [Gemelliphila palaticanis]|nr:ABC transporter ATP-binding protein [Gemella palaticanis]